MQGLVLEDWGFVCQGKNLGHLSSIVQLTRQSNSETQKEEIYLCGKLFIQKVFLVRYGPAHHWLINDGFQSLQGDQTTYGHCEKPFCEINSPPRLLPPLLAGNSFRLLLLPV